MREVGRYPTRAEAEVARSLLTAVRIPCVLVPDDMRVADLPAPSGGARLLVADADALVAAETLAEH